MKLHENFTFNVAGFDTSTGRARGLMAGYACSPGELFEKIFSSVAFYLREGDGHDQIQIGVEHACAACMGRGAVPGTRKMLTCKACKGEPTRPYFMRVMKRADLHDCHLAVVHHERKEG